MMSLEGPRLTRACETKFACSRARNIPLDDKGSTACALSPARHQPGPTAGRTQVEEASATKVLTADESLGWASTIREAAIGHFEILSRRKPIDLDMRWDRPSGSVNRFTMSVSPGSPTE